MKTMTKTCMSLLLVLSPLSRSASGQANPTSTGPALAGPTFQGFQIPRLNGTFEYALTASEMAATGSYYGASGIDYLTNISGDVAYLSQSKVRPFSMVYSGGYFASTSGQPSVFFQNLALSQVFITLAWDFVLSDSVSYLPQTATTGISGVAGVGDLGVAPVQLGAGSPQGILTGYATQVDNTASGSAQRKLTGSTSIFATGSFFLLKFVGSSASAGLDSTGETGLAGASRRIDARNTVSGNYVYSRFTFSGSPIYLTTQGVNVEYVRRFSRKLFMDASAGPQRTTSSPSATNASMTDLAANVAFDYTGKDSTVSLNYIRGVNNGSGVAVGALSDQLGAVANRVLSRNWTASLSAYYARSSSLSVLNTAPFSADTFFGGIQASRAVSRSLFAYLSYTAQEQSIKGTAATLNAFNGLSQVVAVGLTYSPSSMHLGHQ